MSLVLLFLNLMASSYLFECPLSTLSFLLIVASILVGFWRVGSLFADNFLIVGSSSCSSRLAKLYVLFLFLMYHSVICWISFSRSPGP